MGPVVRIASAEPRSAFTAPVDGMDQACPVWMRKASVCLRGKLCRLPFCRCVIILYDEWETIS